MRALNQKNSLLLSMFVADIALGAGHNAFASVPKTLLDTVPKELHGEIGKYETALKSMDNKRIKASTLTAENINTYKVLTGVMLVLDWIDGEVLNLISQLKNIVMIQTSNEIKITDIDLKNLVNHIKNPEEIETLVFPNSSITDAGLAYLKGFKYLNLINLTGANITDAGIVHLLELKNIKSLNVKQTNVTLPALKEFFNRSVQIFH